MKNMKRLYCILFACFAAIILSGCTQANPKTHSVQAFNWASYDTTAFIQEWGMGGTANLWLADLDLDGKQEVIFSISYPPREVPISQTFSFDGESLTEKFGFWAEEESKIYYKENSLLYLAESTHGGGTVSTVVQTDLKTGKSYIIAAKREQWDGQSLPEEYWLFEKQTPCTRDALDGGYDQLEPKALSRQEYQINCQKILEDSHEIDLSKMVMVCNFNMGEISYEYPEEKKQLEAVKPITQKLLDCWEGQKSTATG